MTRRLKKQNEQRPARSAVVAARTGRRVWAGVLAVASLAALTSAYLTYAHYLVRDGGSSICEVGEGLSCDTVAASAFSSVSGLPVAWMGVVFYGFVGWLAWRMLRGRAPVVPRSPELALAAAGVFAGGLSLGLALVSALVIGTFCPLCILLYVFNAALLAFGLVAWWPARGSIGRTVQAEWRNLRRHLADAVGAALVGLLLLGTVPLARAIRPPVSDLCEYVASKRSGDGGTKLNVVVYSDFQCPHCKLADAALEKVRGSKGVSVAMRHYPLDKACNPALERSMHAGACLQASAAICAGPRGAAFARRVFETGARDTSSLVRLASELGEDAAAFERCLGSPETAERLAADIDSAQSAGVRGTPTLVVNGRRYEGRVDAASLSCLEQPASTTGRGAD